MAVELRRRDVLSLMVASAAATVLPRGLGRAAAAQGGSGSAFLSAGELAVLDAATARIIPTDSQPGAHECGVVDYIQNMLSFMPGSDANCDRNVNAADLTAAVLHLNGAPGSCTGGGDVNGDGVVDASDLDTGASALFQARPVYAGGPFSGRQPQPHFPTGNTGCEVCHNPPVQQPIAAHAVAVSAVVDNYPPDAFKQFLPLPRLRLLSWKVRILGAAAVPEVANNPLATSLPEVDLRRKYRDGLAGLESKSQQLFGKPFVQLTVTQQSSVLDAADSDFVSLLTVHTFEGMFCAPEYGGNRDRLGWQLIKFDGDSQPLGYEIYDETLGGYRERPDKPNSGPNPDETCGGFSPGVTKFLKAISRTQMVQPGSQFSTPYCLDVP